MEFAHILKANPYHDELGRFSTQDKAKFVSIGGVFASQRKPGSGDSSSGDVDPSVPKKASDEAEKGMNLESDQYTLNNWLGGIKANAEAKGLTQKEYEKQIADEYRAALKDASVSMRVTEASLSKILDEGFKNQYETNKSGGHLNEGMRQRAEAYIFGLDGMETYYEKKRLGEITEKNVSAGGVKYVRESGHLNAEQAKARPLYGYISGKDHPFGSGSLEGYGGVAIEFKESVRRSSTFSDGDTLDVIRSSHDHGKGGEEDLFNLPRMGFSPVNNPSARSAFFNFGSRQSNLGSLNGTGAGYVEAQIFKRPSISDIKKVRFRKPPSKALEAKLKKLGIDYEVVA